MFWGQRGRVRSGIGLARLVRGGEIGLRRALGVESCALGFGLFDSPRTSQETHTHHPQTRHAPRHSLTLLSCKNSFVSRFLSVVSLISCLTCLVSALLQSSVCAVFFVFLLSVCLSVYVALPCVCACGDLCLRRANQANLWWRLVAILTSKSFAILVCNVWCVWSFAMCVWNGFSSSTSLLTPTLGLLGEGAPGI